MTMLAMALWCGEVGRSERWYEGRDGQSEIWQRYDVRKHFRRNVKQDVRCFGVLGEGRRDLMNFS